MYNYVSRVSTVQTLYKYTYIQHQNTNKILYSCANGSVSEIKKFALFFK